MNEYTSLTAMLRALKLPGFAAGHSEIGEMAARQGWSFDAFLHHLAEIELSERRQRRIERNLRASDLPREKTLGQLDLTRLPTVVRRQLPNLCNGDFADGAQNLLLFGLPGRGKTHVACAIGHELVRRGVTVHFSPAFKIVQRLVAARRELRLERELRRLDAFDVLILDDIGYIQQDRDEMEVLFTLFAERYERRSVVITSNLVFSQWDRIFKDPLTTAAAIDRMVHHAVILELTGRSKRSDDALARNSVDSAQPIDAELVDA